MRIAILSCSKNKTKLPMPARDVYIGPLFKWARRYAELTCDDMRIISARLGLLEPDTIVQPYEAFPESSWASSDYRRLIKNSPVNDHIKAALESLVAQGHRLIYLCSGFYTDLGPPGERPLMGMDFYQRRAFLITAVEKTKERSYDSRNNHCYRR